MSRSKAGPGAGRAGARPRPASAGSSAARPRRDSRPLRSRTLGADPGPQRRSTLTTRAALLGLALSAVALLLALPARTWFAQQSALASAQRDQAEQRHRIELLTQQVRRLGDPATVQEQALQRLGYVKPGERVYQVIDPPRPAPAHRPAGVALPAAASAPTRTGPWWSQLWGTPAGG
jgi:cell division protein FtsB